MKIAAEKLARMVIDQHYDGDPRSAGDEAIWQEREVDLTEAITTAIADEVGCWRRADHYDHTDPYGPSGPQHDRIEEVRGER